MTGQTSTSSHVDTDRSARVTGAWYLGLAISGVLGFLLIRSRLYEPGDAVATAENLVANVGLARAGIAADLTIVVTQSVVALWFYRTFRRVDAFAAGSLTAFAFMNSAILLVATAFSATALEVAVAGATGAGDASTVLLLYQLSGTAWAVDALFAGLWLLPMGWLVLQSGRMPRALGWILIVGGVGYLASAYTDFLFPGTSWVVEALTMPATIGEFWMIGYLLFRGAGSPLEDS